MSREFVEYEKDGHTAIITLNRPERMNALGAELLRDLHDVWHEFESDDDIFVAIYTGTGKAFCSGKDIKEAAGSSPIPAPLEFSPLASGAGSKPVIAAVNGFAMGGGFMDVLRCDLRIAVEGAQFEFSEVARSVLPHPVFRGITGVLPDALVTELALGSRLTAARLYEIGLLNRVVPADALMAEARQLADRILALPPLAVKFTLEGLRLTRQVGSDEREHRIEAWERNADAVLQGSTDAREAMQSFLERRPPVYRGR
jgi:enoyl-CoA hydratase/carnithine racemase